MAKLFGRHRKASGNPMFYSIRTRSRGAKRLRHLLSTPATLVAGGVIVLGLAAWLVIDLVFPAPEIQPPAPNTFGYIIGEISPEIDEAFRPDVKEIMLRVRKIGDPVINGGEAIFAGGTDSAGNPKLRTVYYYDLKKKTDRPLSEIVLQNDDLMNLALNDRFIVWADAKRTGSCNIRYLNRSTGAIRTVKNCPISVPKLRLEDNVLCWTERTADKEDKLYAYDLNTSESVTLAVFYDSPAGASPPGIGGGKIVWAEDDDSGDQIGNSVIRTLTLGSGEVETFVTGMYVFGPQTNGVATVWIDQNRGPDASLYMSADTQPIRCIEKGGVNDYALGNRFVAYHKDGVLYAYLFKENKKVRISGEGEKVILSGVYGDTVVWFDVSNDAVNRDIVYYAAIE